MSSTTKLKTVISVLWALVLILQFMFIARPASADPVSVIDDLDKAFVQIAANVTPAVVLIQVITPDGSSGSGSGFLISPDGDIITNAHVVADAKEIGVTLSSKQEYEAKLVGLDRDTDLGMLKIEATGLPVLKLGDSSKLRMGEIVFAVGNPLGYSWSATFGIVSATGRTDRYGINSYTDSIQTNALINPGNSGGPLVNIRGEVVGITNWREREIGVAGLSFAVPSNSAKLVMNDLKKNGRVDRGYLGIDSFKDLTRILATSLGRSDTKGVLVTSVVKGSPAYQAGVKAGDVILAYDGHPVDDASSFKMRLGQARPNTTAKLTTFRKGETLEVAAGFTDHSVKGEAVLQTIWQKGKTISR